MLGNALGYRMLTRQEALEIAYAIPGQTWPTELGWIYDTVRERVSRKYVDVGTYCGRSLWIAAAGMASHGETGQVIAVDNFSEQIEATWASGVIRLTLNMIHRKFPTVTTKLIELGSLEAMRVVENPDFVFIDANHNYAECLADIEGWSGVAVPDAVICGHDYWPAHIGVMDAVNHFYRGTFKVIPGTRIWRAT
jgi:predicted O-methyltransferase YrrM